MPDGCGEAFDRQQGRDEPLAMIGSFPRRVRARNASRFHGTVTVTNHADVPIRGTSASQPDVFVTRSGKIVATPVARDDVGVLVDLAPGDSRVFNAEGSLVGCVLGAGGGSPDERPLAPGRYQICAVLRVHEALGGRSVTAIGGPWPLKLVSNEGGDGEPSPPGSSLGV